jgi:phage shock protein E
MRTSIFILAALLAMPAGAWAGHSISPQELLSQLDGGDAPLVIDVRSKREYESGHVPGAVNIPHRELRDRLPEVSRAADSDIVVYCEAGPRARIAWGTLEDAGFTGVHDLKGHMATWRAEGHPLQ